jgi:hypothetical protein
MIDLNSPKMQLKMMEYFMFTDKRQIPLDQYMLTYHNECTEVGKTLVRMLDDGYLSSMRITTGGEVVCL